MSGWLERIAAEAGRSAAEVVTVERMVRRGAVAELAVEPGAASALVTPPRSSALRATVGVRRFADDQWAEVIGAYGASPRALTDLLAGQLPTLDPPASPDVLPGVSDLAFDCPCGAWNEPCGHALAVVAALDALFADDPLAVLVLRGRDRAEVIDAVRAASIEVGVRSAELGAVAAVPSDGVAPVRTPAVASSIPGRSADAGESASSVFRAPLGPLPSVAIPQRRAGRRARMPEPLVAPPADAGLDGAAMVALAADAASRARALLTGDPSAAEMAIGDRLTDAVRRCAAGRDGIDRAAVATRLGLEAGAVDWLVDAWRVGGAAAIEVLTRPRRPSAAEVDDVRARLAVTLEAEELAATLATVAARSTGVRCRDGQLRRSADGTWVRLVIDEEHGWRVVAASADLGDLW